jgi:type IV fimbrial biogenesis protein FimT
LIELLAALCVAAIVASLALPSLDNLALNERRTAVVNDLMLTLMVARSETAKRRGRPLVACGIDDRDNDGTLDSDEQQCSGRDWSDGWMLGTWNDANGNATVDAAEFIPVRVFQNGSGGRLTVTTGNFTASPPVRPAGTMLIKAFGRRTSNGTITVCDRRGAAAARAVIVSPFGRARVSSTRADGTPLRCP